MTVFIASDRGARNVTVNQRRRQKGDVLEGWERKKSTRGRKVTERPHPAWPSLKEKRWNTHTDLPSVNRVSKRGRERGREERGRRAREGEARRAAFVFVQLIFLPPAGLLISGLSPPPVPPITTLILDKDSKDALPKFFSFVAVCVQQLHPNKVTSSSFSQRRTVNSCPKFVPILPLMAV